MFDIFGARNSRKSGAERFRWNAISKLMEKEVTIKPNGREKEESHGAFSFALVTSVWTHSWRDHSLSDRPSSIIIQTTFYIFTVLWGRVHTWSHLILATRNPRRWAGELCPCVADGENEAPRRDLTSWVHDKVDSEKRSFLQTILSKILTQMYSSCYGH